MKMGTAAFLGFFPGFLERSLGFLILTKTQLILETLQPLPKWREIVTILSCYKFF